MEKGDCKRSFKDAVKELNLKMIKKILEQENISEHKINGALFTVVYICQCNTALLKQIICVLVSHGANINTVNINSSTILNVCCSGQIMIVKFLINLGADTNISDVQLWNPLMSACNMGYTEAIKLLVPITKNINQQSKSGWTAIMLASRSGYIKNVDYLLDTGADIKIKSFKYNDNALIVAAWKGHVNTVKLLVEKGKSSVNVKGEDGLTALGWANYGKHTECVKYLTNKVAKSKSITKTSLMKIINVDICNIITEFLDFRV